MHRRPLFTLELAGRYLQYSKAGQPRQQGGYEARPFGRSQAIRWTRIQATRWIRGQATRQARSRAVGWTRIQATRWYEARQQGGYEARHQGLDVTQVTRWAWSQASRFGRNPGNKASTVTQATGGDVTQLQKESVQNLWQQDAIKMGT
jgi:hypothetical protein